jgi:hypothetical protein
LESSNIGGRPVMRDVRTPTKGVALMFSDQQVERLKQWSNVYGWSAEECTAAAEADETLRRLLDVEMGAGGVSDEARAIRAQITRIEVCHYHCKSSVERILQMIGQMQPAPVLGCGDTEAHLADQVRGIMAEAAAWVDGRTQDSGSLSGVLGERTPAKQWLTACLCKTLAKQLERVQGDEPLPQPQWPTE